MLIPLRARSDYNSVTVMKQQLNASCGVGLDEQANFTVTPNEAVQYYRASSFALLLEVSERPSCTAVCEPGKPTIRWLTHHTGLQQLSTAQPLLDGQCHGRRHTAYAFAVDG